MNKRGFTLLEVLVALAVIAFALAALIQASGQRADQAGYLRDRVLATWVAQNVLEERRIRRDYRESGTVDGKYEMMGRQWWYEVRYSPVKMLNVPEMRQLEVAVGLEADRPLAQLLATMLNPRFDGQPGEKTSIKPAAPAAPPSGDAPVPGGGSNEAEGDT